jgi:hypothetical protein
MDVAEIVSAWVSSCYSAMGIPLEDDLDVAFGVCLHWEWSGRVMGLKDWKLQMFGPDDPKALAPGWPENEPEYQEVRRKLDFDFKIFDREGRFVEYQETPKWRTG